MNDFKRELKKELDEMEVENLANVSLDELIERRGDLLKVKNKFKNNTNKDNKINIAFNSYIDEIESEIKRRNN